MAFRSKDLRPSEWTLNSSANFCAGKLWGGWEFVACPLKKGCASDSYSRCTQNANAASAMSWTDEIE